MSILNIIIIVLNTLVLMTSYYTFYLYKDKNLHNYLHYNLLILSIIILIDIIFKLIPTLIMTSVFKYIQAIILTFLDKFLLTTTTSQLFIIYFWIMKTKSYIKYQKIIFFCSLFITIFIDLLIVIIFFLISQKISNHKEKKKDFIGIDYYYYEGNIKEKLIDTIFNSIFFCFNVYCIIFIFYSLNTKKIFIILSRIILLIFATLSLFIESYLIIYEQIPIEYIDLIHLIIYLIVNLCYPINIILRGRLDILLPERNDKNEDDKSYTFNSRYPNNVLPENYKFNPRDTDDAYPGTYKFNPLDTNDFYPNKYHKFNPRNTNDDFYYKSDKFNPRDTNDDFYYKFDKYKTRDKDDVNPD